MVKHTPEELNRILFEREKIRNMSVIAHVDHGKSTLTDSLAAAAGLIDSETAGEKRVCDIDKNEIEMGITIKSTSLSMILANPDVPNEEDKYLVNLIDSPGHIDFNSEVTAALRVTDGAMVVVDAVEGCRGQTETVLRQALQEKIKPVLMINKIDRLIEEVQYTPEESYQSFQRIIESINVLISTYAIEDERFGDPTIDPIVGNVAFGSAKQGFAFTLDQFATLYSAKFKISKEKLLPKLWGENYFDHETRKWTTEPFSKSGKALKRTFCEFVLEPIFKIFTLVREREKIEENLPSELSNILTTLSITLKKEDERRDNKTLLKIIMRKFLPASDALVQMIVRHLPSPVKAQKYRYELLYTGDLNDRYAEAIRDCDPNGPLVIFISKMIPMHSNTSQSSITSNVGRFIAFGRIFSGTLSQSSKVRILGPCYEGPTSKKDVFNANVQRCMIMMGKTTESVVSVSCGCVCGVGGLEKYIVKTCTVTDEDNIDCMPIKNMKYSVSPVVQMAVEPQNPSDITKFVEGLKRLVKSDTLIECRTNEAGQHIIAAAGELHLKLIMKNLEEEYAKGIPIKKSEPVVSFLETVTKTGDICLSKSSNNHNRLYFQAEPLQDELVALIEEGQVGPKDDLNKRSKLLESEFNWDPTVSKKIWSFGPFDKGSNLVVNATKAVDYLNEIQEYVVSSFQSTSLEGALCDEPMRGIRFNVMDAQLHADAIHRGAGQIIQAARRGMLASELKAVPKLIQPIYLVEIQCPSSCVGSIHSVISNRKGMVKTTEVVSGTPLLNISCHVPVLESFGLAEELRGQTQGQAFPQCSFDHWKIMDQDVYGDNQVNKMIKSIRKRKGLKKEEVPLYTDFA